MTISANNEYLLNNFMGPVANKVSLGTLIKNAESVTADEIGLADGKVLIGNASNVGAAQSLSGDITTTNAGVTSIGAGKVSEAKLVVPGTDGLNAKRIARATYDFSVLGGVVGDIGLGVSLPDNAVITRAWLEVISGMTSAGGAGTIALKAEGAGDILAAVDADTLSGFVEGIQDGAAANFVKTSAARELTATIAVEDLTAGKFILFVEYVVSE